jgi:nitrate/TMAO reductase-like tetraheme cytochrome c subunit
MTSGCHDLDSAPKPANNPKKGAEGSMKYFKNAFHTQCIGCHKAIKMKNVEIEKSFSAVKAKQMKTGPTGCTVCHAK